MLIPSRARNPPLHSQKTYIFPYNTPSVPTSPSNPIPTITPTRCPPLGGRYIKKTLEDLLKKSLLFLYHSWPSYPSYPSQPCHCCNHGSGGAGGHKKINQDKNSYPLLIVSICGFPPVNRCRVKKLSLSCCVKALNRCVRIPNDSVWILNRRACIPDDSVCIPNSRACILNPCAPIPDDSVYIPDSRVWIPNRCTFFCLLISSRQSSPSLRKSQLK